MKVGLVDYGRGNLRSVEKALERVGFFVYRVTSPAGLDDVEALVLPGVGAFGDAMEQLRRADLVQALINWWNAGRPFLGICLGYQLLFEQSEESPEVNGLGCLPGRVRRLDPARGKVPHMGWSRVSWTAPLVEAFDGSPPEWFYHVHSFYPELQDRTVTACTTDYGLTFVSGVVSGRRMAFQFHPEKSQASGERLLRLWRQWIKAR